MLREGDGERISSSSAVPKSSIKVGGWSIRLMMRTADGKNRVVVGY
jgi:hypothetical protein